jgi:hypothetical protein
MGVEALVAARTDIAFAQFQHIYARVCNRIEDGQTVPDIDPSDILPKKPYRSNPPRLSCILRNLP